MKTHFSEDEYGEKGICGNYSEELNDDWNIVDCKKCLRLKEKYIEQCKINMEVDCRQMKEMKWSGLW